MKILTIGTGVIGTIYSFILKSSGNSVTHYVRKGKIATINKKITIDMLDKRKGYPKRQEYTYEYDLIDSLSSENNYDYIFVAVRVCQLNRLLKDINGLTGSATIVIFTGNWYGTDFIEKYLPHGSFLFVDPIAGGVFNDNNLVATINNYLQIGEIDGSKTKRLKDLSEIFNAAGIKTKFPKNILEWDWLQFALNAGMWPALVRAGNVKEIIKKPLLISEIYYCINECIEVCIKRGINIDNYPEIKLYTTKNKIKLFFIKKLFPVLLEHSEYHKRCMAHALDDPKEIKTFYEDVLQTGINLNVDMPYFKKFKNDIYDFTKKKSI